VFMCLCAMLTPMYSESQWYIYVCTTRGCKGMRIAIGLSKKKNDNNVELKYMIFYSHIEWEQ